MTATSGPPTTAAADHPARLDRVREVLQDQGIGALIVTPSADLRYLTGYDALPLERLTALVVPAQGDPVVIVPALERPAALASPIGAAGLMVAAWTETEDPFSLVAGVLGDVSVVAVADQMWAEKLLRLQAALPRVRTVAGGRVLRELRMRKTDAEVAALRRAGAAIDAVHAEVPTWLRVGRTEREVGKDIADAILAAGHASVEFVIVGSGLNGASPHHELSDRVIAEGDPVVVDIGGTMPDGYCSDSTRTYVMGEPPAEYAETYEVLLAAQRAACHSVRPGVLAEDVDSAARDVLAAAGFGDLFIHRTGHGIGLECHEEPYIVAGSAVALEPGMTFSIEPGFYVEGRWGARIEDIVACTGTGVERLNLRPRELVTVQG